VYVRKRMFVLLTSNTTVTMKKGESLVVEITADPLLISQIGTTVDIPALFQGVNDTSEASIAVDGCSGSMIGVERFLTSAGGTTTSTDCTASYLNEEDTENVDTEEEIGDDGSGDLMPDDWTYPGFIAFALLGPIVPPAMVPYRTELFMTGLPPVALGDTSNGRAEMRRMDKSKKRADATRMKTSGQITKAASEVLVKQEESVSLQQKILVAGIAQSRGSMELRTLQKMHDQVTSMHKEKVAAIRMFITNQKDLISYTAVDDPDRIQLISQLKGMHEDLKKALADLITARKAILNEHLENAQKSKSANSFIDLTIASVLGASSIDTDTNPSFAHDGKQQVHVLI
jgi:hypothetical protein